MSKDELKAAGESHTKCWDGLKSSLNALQTFVIAGERHCQPYLSQQLHLATQHTNMSRQ